jgi:hypothetical protein
VTRDEMMAAMEATNTRIEALRARLIDASETSLLTGEWRVRDALSHLAARANPVQRALRRMESATSGSAPQPALDIHDENAGQVRDREDLSVAGLLDEIAAGHQAMVADLAALDDATLERRFPVAFPPGELSLAEFVMRAGSGHENNHLTDIEAALG